MCWLSSHRFPFLSRNCVCATRLLLDEIKLWFFFKLFILALNGDKNAVKPSLWSFWLSSQIRKSFLQFTPASSKWPRLIECRERRCMFSVQLIFTRVLDSSGKCRIRKKKSNEMGWNCVKVSQINQSNTQKLLFNWKLCIFSMSFIIIVETSIFRRTRQNFSHIYNRADRKTFFYQFQSQLNKSVGN